MIRQAGAEVDRKEGGLDEAGVAPIQKSGRGLAREWKKEADGGQATYQKQDALAGAGGRFRPM